MKKIFLCLLILPICSCFAQNLKLYKADNDVSLLLPEISNTIEKMGQRTTITQMEDGGAIFSRSVTTDSLSAIDNEDDLEKYYDGVKKGYLESLKGKLLEKRIINHKGLKICHMRVHSPENNSYFSSYILFLNNRTYALQFVSAQPNIALEKRIFSSLQFRKGLTIENQFNYRTAERYGEIFGMLLVPIFIVLIIVFALRKKKTF